MISMLISMLISILVAIAIDIIVIYCIYTGDQTYRQQYYKSFLDNIYYIMGILVSSYILYFIFPFKKVFYDVLLVGVLFNKYVIIMLIIGGVGLILYYKYTEKQALYEKIGKLDEKIKKLDEFIKSVGKMCKYIEKYSNEDMDNVNNFTTLHDYIKHGCKLAKYLRLLIDIRDYVVDSKDVNSYYANIDMFTSALIQDTHRRWAAIFKCKISDINN